MATSTQQKQELFKSIWAIANELRGSVDGWDFKQLFRRDWWPTAWRTFIIILFV